MLDSGGIFDPVHLTYIWEEAAIWAFGHNLKLKTPKEIDDAWNGQLDDSNSELTKEYNGVYGKGVQDIEINLEDTGITPQGIREAVKMLGDRLKTLGGVLAGADRAPVFLQMQKDAFAYADKLEKETPMEPVKIEILPGKSVTAGAIRGKEYSEKGYAYCQYEVIVTLENGQAIRGPVMYSSERDAQSSTRVYRPNNIEMQKQKVFVKRYEKAVDSVGKEVSSLKHVESVNIDVIGIAEINKADDIIKKRVVPALEKEFPKAEVKF